MCCRSGAGRRCAGPAHPRPGRAGKGYGCRHHAAAASGWASAAGSAERSSGSGRPSALAARRRCAMREAGIPMFRQLWTVDVGASISLATAEVPPR